MGGTLQDLLDFAASPQGIAALLSTGDAISLYTERDALVVQNQDVIFPEDLKYAYIHMRFSKYKRRSIREQPFFEPQNSIRLPLPAELNDSFSVSYDKKDLGPMVGAAADAIAGQSFNSVGDFFTALAQSAFSIPAGAGAAAIQTAADGNAPGLTQGGRDIVATTVQGLQSLTGLTPNPFQTVLFKSPDFKTHKFSWTLIPKSDKESNAIEFILRLFKYHMLPGISGATVFFSFPQILEIKLFPQDKYLYKFKPCVVESISVDYAPNGPSFYRSTGAPAAVKFTIGLQEIEIWTKVDYARDSSGRIQANRGLNPFPSAGSLAPNLRAGIE